MHELKILLDKTFYISSEYFHCAKVLDFGSGFLVRLGQLFFMDGGILCACTCELLTSHQFLFLFCIQIVAVSGLLKINTL